MGSRVRSNILAVTGSASLITQDAFTTYINYASLQLIAVKDRFRVWIQFILPLVDPESMAWDGSFQQGAGM